MLLKQSAPRERAQLIGYGALLTAGLSAALGFGLSGLWIEMLISLGFTVLALFSESRPWGQPWAGPTFAGFAVLGGGGLLRGLPTLFGLITLAAALITWDLHYFTRRIEGVDRIAEERHLVREHLQRLFVVVGLGLAGGGLSLLIRVDYGLGILILLGLVLVFGLSRAVSYLRKESD